MGVMIRGGGGLIDEAPVVTELKTVGEPTQTSISISYKVTDAELQIVRHYLTVSGVYDKKEITKEVGYDIPDGVYTYTITGLTKGTTYTIQIMCSDGLLEGNSNALQASTESIVLYSFTITEADSNPATRVKYGDEAVGVSPATSNSLGGWEDKWPFNNIRMVGLQNGKITKEVNKNNKKQYIDGTTVPTNFTVDVMTEFPTIYWRKTAPSGQIKFEISDYPIVGGDCYAHKVGGVIRPAIYVGSYLGFTPGGADEKLYSVSGAIPRPGYTLTNFRTTAQRKGAGYNLLNFNILTMLQVLFTLAYRNTNSQSALGMGYTNESAKGNTGGADQKGWVYGSQNSQEQMCFLGIEDLWGNLYQWIDGLYIDDNYNILVCTSNTNFNDTGDGYENLGQSGTGGMNRLFISKIQQGTKAGFLIKDYNNGSSSTYYCDNGSLNKGTVAYVGGSYNDGNACGIFSIHNIISPTYGDYDKGARLVYIGEVS